MKKYIAVSPVRFDRDYAIGEEIPAGIVDAKVERRLAAQGKIAPLPETAPSGAGPGSQEAGPGSGGAAAGGGLKTDGDADTSGGVRKDDTADVGGVTKTDDTADVGGVTKTDDTADTGVGAKTEDAADAGDGSKTDGAGHICDICGKECANKAALATHKKSHEKSAG